VRRILAVARNTFREAVRNKVLYTLLFFAVALIVSALALGQLSVNEDRRMIRDIGLFGIDLFSVLIAIFVGVNLLYKELALKTVYTILPKSIARWEFILGKWLGVMATLAVQVVVMGAVLVVTLRVQGSTDAVADSTLPKALWLLFMNVTIVTSVAMWFSSFSSPFLSGVFSLGVFVVGRSIPDLRQLAVRLGGTAGSVLDTLASLLPNLHLFFPSGSTVGSQHVSVHGDFVGLPYVGMATAYAMGYSALVLGWAMLIFRKRDFV
jgi:ABC-type transport system involved in multi-copper enzyme maturation permease subunit